MELRAMEIRTMFEETMSKLKRILRSLMEIIGNSSTNSKG